MKHDWSHISNLAWRRSTYSGSNGGECVEVAEGIPGLVPVRDSKNPTGPALAFSAASWSSFIDAVKRGELTHNRL